MKCRFCSGLLRKAGNQKNGTQKYYCKHCRKYQQKTYQYRAYNLDVNHRIESYVQEGVGIRSIARILEISTTTVIKRIVSIAEGFNKPTPIRKGEYEIDERWTFCTTKLNPIWITYILERRTSRVIDFHVGRRTKEVLTPMIDRLLPFSPKLIATDGLLVYKAIIPEAIHGRQRHQTMNIERYNLNLRTHIKRLSRKTINYSRSLIMLKSILRIYFFNRSDLVLGVSSSAEIKIVK